LNISYFTLTRKTYAIGKIKSFFKLLFQLYFRCNYFSADLSIKKLLTYNVKIVGVKVPIKKFAQEEDLNLET
jgi:hypothetical protein